MTGRAATLRGPGQERAERCERSYKITRRPAGRGERSERDDSTGSYLTRSRPGAGRALRAGLPERGARVMTRRAATLRGPGRERGERCERGYKTAVGA